MSKVIELKTINPYFDDVKTGRKSFQIRSNDRNFQVGDVLHLKEWRAGKFTGNICIRIITGVFDLCDKPDGLKHKSFFKPDTPVVILSIRSLDELAVKL